MGTAYAEAMIGAAGRRSANQQPGPAGRGRGGGRLAFDATKRNRQLNEWIARHHDPIDLINQHLGLLQARCRDLAINAWPVKSAIQAITDAIIDPQVGIRIKPQVMMADGVTPAKRVNRELRMMLEQQSQAFDIDGRESFATFLQNVTREWVEVGECFVVEMPDTHPDRPVPVAWRIVPAERCDHTFNRGASSGSAGGRSVNRITNGIEFDARGRRVAYHFWKSDEYGRTARERERIPADRVKHLFVRMRAGQERGLPWVYAAVILSHDLDDLVDDELTSAHVATMLTAFLYRENAGLLPDNQETSTRTTSDGNQIETPEMRFEAGAVVDLGVGEKVEIADPNRPGGNFLPFAGFIAMCIGRCMGISYERLTGDYSKTNFASGQLSGIREREATSAMGYAEVQLIGRPIWRALVKHGVSSGVLKTITPAAYAANAWRFTRAKMRIKAHEHHKPLEDITASALRIATGVSTLEEECDRVNLDWEDVLEQRQVELQTMRERDIPVVLPSGSSSVGGQGSGVGGFEAEDRGGDDGEGGEDDPDPRGEDGERQGDDDQDNELANTASALDTFGRLVVHQTNGVHL